MRNPSGTGAAGKPAVGCGFRQDSANTFIILKKLGEGNTQLFLPLAKSCKIWHYNLCMFLYTNIHKFPGGEFYMEKLGLNEIRELFLSFYQSKDHYRRQSFPLIRTLYTMKNLQLI